jgi:phage baseplate assembly protein W|tara:strand:+ start:39 stop:407 length:369 start_codon:yes stop_codon:yes gene_type:complete
MATIFRGFSTVDRVNAPFSLSDMELVKRDLLNEFNTRKGERVMRPNFGCIVWDLLMNPEDAFTEDEIKEDITRIVEKDSRVDLINISVFSDAHTVRAEVELRYVILNSKDTLYLEFKDEQQV